MPSSTSTYVRRYFCRRLALTSLLKVDGRIFTVFSRHFRLESEQTRELLARTTERPDGVIVIDNMKALDFERFVEAMYCGYAELITDPALSDIFASASQGLPVMVKDKWISILRVAHRIGFASMRAFAVKHLSNITTAVDRIVLAHEFGVDDWIKSAYVEVCKAPQFISEEDIDRLGFELFRKIARVRDMLKDFIVPSNSPFGMPSPPEPDAAAIVEDVFQLHPPALEHGPDDWFAPAAAKKGKKGKK